MVPTPMAKNLGFMGCNFSNLENNRNLKTELPHGLPALCPLRSYGHLVVMTTSVHSAIFLFREPL